jgi:hypothetical protein
LGAVMIGARAGRGTGQFKEGENRRTIVIWSTLRTGTDRPRRRQPSKSIQPLRESVNELFIMRASFGAWRGKTLVEVYARSWPSPADPPRSLPCRSDGIVSSAHRFQRLSAYRWSPEEFLQRGEVGAPRSMKMGTTPSPCLYDAAVRRALQSVNLRRPATLHCASWTGVLPASQRGRLSLR